jgi:GDP-L-fucose synthase
MLKHRPDIVFHLAAKVAGVMSNTLFPADFYTQNIKINTNVLESALELAMCWNDELKVISVMSTCVYPDKARYPLTEDQMHNGPPHPSNFAYAYTKRMLDVQSQAYRKQHGVNFLTVIPNNLYGKGDLYGFGCHIIPALMYRFHKAKLHNAVSVDVWGDGTPLREFTFAPDMARDLYNIARSYSFRYAENMDELGPVNIGNTKEYSVKEIANIMKEVVEYKGDVLFDPTKPNGQLKKPSSTRRFEKLMGKTAYTDLRKGLEITYNWFKENYPNLRGVKQ